MTVLYSFRRCPYAIRARFALCYAGIPFELKEVRLSDKPADMLKLSRKGTVPVLQLTDGRVIDESVDIVSYALSQNDPNSYALYSDADKQRCDTWLQDWQPRWVTAINHYKYHDRYPELDREDSWLALKELLQTLENSLAKHDGYAIRESFSQADILLLPLIRQFAIIDQDFFQAQPWPYLKRWLGDWMASSLYEQIMQKTET